MRHLYTASLLVAAFSLAACGTSSSTGRPNGWAASPSAPRVSTPPPPPRTAARPPARGRPPVRTVSAPEPGLETAAAARTASGLLVPVAGVAPGELRDSFTAARSGGRRHNAIDIAAPRGTPLVAVEDGYIRRKHWNRLGGRTLYLTSTDESTDYYYAHLDTYADGIEIGTRVRQGDVIGTVGATGNARGAHLHFQVLDRSGRGRGTPVNPYNLLSVPAEQ